MIRGSFSEFEDMSKETSSPYAVTQQVSKIGATLDTIPIKPSMAEGGSVGKAVLDNCDSRKNNYKYFSSDKLSDGRVVVLRAIRPNDKQLLSEGMHHLSKSSRYFRFFAHKEELTEAELAFFTEIDFEHHVALLASVVDGAEERPAGVGRYVVSSNDAEVSVAELAFVVIEEYRGLGIATLLLKHLIKIAKAGGIEQLTASVLPENRAMQRVLYKSGLPNKQIVNSADVLEFTLSLK